MSLPASAVSPASPAASPSPERVKYVRCVGISERVSWTVEGVVAGRQFDLTMPLLPEAVARTRDVAWLSDAERLRLNHIRAASYLHLFAFFEEVVPPLLSGLAGADLHGDKARLRGLMRFIDEELKHQALFDHTHQLLESQLGFRLGRLSGAADVSRAANQNDRLAVLLLVAAFEWMTQTHFARFVQENQTEQLDSLFGDVLRAHWLEESQHAKLDELELQGLLVEATPAVRERALEQLFGLGAVVLDLVANQMRLDVSTLEQHGERTFTDAQREELVNAQVRAGHHAMLGMGLAHPSFLQLVEQVFPPARVKVEGVAAQLSY